MKLYKNPDNSWTVGTLLSVPSGTCFIEEISADVYAIRFINAPSNIFIGAITDLERSDESPYEDIATFLTECGDFFVNPLNPLKEDVGGLKLNKADLVNGKVPAEQLPSYVDDVINVEHWSDTEPAALEDELWYDTVNHDLSVYDGEAWIAVDMDYGCIYVNVDESSDSYNSTFRYNGVSLILLGANVTREFLEGILQTRTLALPAYDIDMDIADDFTKLDNGASSVFTISNPIIKKAFRLFITGGTIAAPLFTGYTSTWVASTLIGDYNPAIVNVLVCEIRSAGEITLFWGV